VVKKLKRGRRTVVDRTLKYIIKTDNTYPDTPFAIFDTKGKKIGYASSIVMAKKVGTYRGY
jgi:hypothetical protein